MLELVRIHVVAAADDHVLGAAGEIELTVGEIAEIAGIQPLTVHKLGSGFGIPIIAGGCRRAAELNPPLRALRKLTAVPINDAYPVARKDAAAGDNLQRLGFVGAAGSARPV